MVRTKQLYDKWISFEEISLEECVELRDRLKDIKSFIPDIVSNDKIKVLRKLRNKISRLNLEIENKGD